MSQSSTSLHRSITLPMLLLYGLGTMVGGGFYALVGKVTASAGDQMPLAFVVASVIAGFTAWSFSELAGRYPSSAGESRYVLEAFGRPSWATATGWLVVLTGVVSAATLCNAFGRFAEDLLGISGWVGVVGVVVALAGVAAWGIGESVALAVLITLIEVGGLLAVVIVRREVLWDLPGALPSMLLPPTSLEAGWGVMVGAFLAFYAFVGFEDMVNLAEEVVDIERTMPLAIGGAMLITTLLYVGVGSIAVLAVDAEVLVSAATPMAVLVQADGGSWAVVMTIISMLAGVNGALMQIVMASRVVYGMAARGLAPELLGRVHPSTRTPVVATVVVAVAVWLLATLVDLVSLARATSGVLLAVFTLVNLSLAVIHRRDGPAPSGIVRVPIWAPWVGALLTSGLLLLQLWVLFAGSAPVAGHG
jgi:amino acid transporter